MEKVGKGAFPAEETARAKVAAAPFPELEHRETQGRPPRLPSTLSPPMISGSFPRFGPSARTDLHEKLKENLLFTTSQSSLISSAPAPTSASRNT